MLESHGALHILRLDLTNLAGVVLDELHCESAYCDAGKLVIPYKGLRCTNPQCPVW